MASNVDTFKPPLHEQITELKRQIQLLEGERTAEYETTQSAISKNAETIRQLRQQNKELRKKQAEANAGDEHVIKAAFLNRGKEMDAYRNLSRKDTFTKLKQSVLLKTKQLNAQKHITQNYQRRYEELKKESERMVSEGSNAHTQKQEEDAMNLRALENRLEKTHLKCKAADKVMTDYLKLKSYLQNESLTYQGQLDGLEAELLKKRNELHILQATNNDAQLAKQAAKAELQQLEELLNKERKERERTLASYRKKVEDLKAQAEKADRRAQRITMQPDELSSEAPLSTTRMAVEGEKAISTSEEFFKRIKEATGLTDIQEIAERFTSQKETHQQLEKLKRENEEVLQQLREQKQRLTQQFEDMKYSGEAKRSSEQQMLEERKQQLQAQQQRRDAARERLDSLVGTLSTVRAGVEHLADKLQHITLSADTGAEVETDSELMAQCGKKIQSLQEQLQGKDLAAIRKQMEEEEFCVRIEGKLPEYNTRVKLPEDQTLNLSDDKEESEEDEAAVPSREELKRQAQLITWKKKKSRF